MSITLELTPAEEARLREAARARDMDIEAFLKTSGLQAAERSTVEELAHDAVRAAQNELRHKGISSVYERNGQIVEELPDGSCVPLAAEAC